MSQQWKMICQVTDIPVLGARVLKRAASASLPARPDVALFRNSEDKVFALLDRCPHKGGPLSQGIVFGERVACPLHGWNIALDGGCAVAPDVGCTQSFAVKVDDGRVYLDVDELARPPTAEQPDAAGCAGAEAVIGASASAGMGSAAVSA